MDINARSGGEYAYTVQAEDFHGTLSSPAKFTNPTSQSLSITQQAGTTCSVLGAVYDEENYSITEASQLSRPAMRASGRVRRTPNTTKLRYSASAGLHDHRALTLSTRSI